MVPFLRVVTLHAYPLIRTPNPFNRDGLAFWHSILLNVSIGYFNFRVSWIDRDGYVRI